LQLFHRASAYAQVGAERELLQMMAYEPMVLLTAVGFYAYTGSFRVDDIMQGSNMRPYTACGNFWAYISY
jgi:NADH:ubiquinone oxidoreductase subunit H